MKVKLDENMPSSAAGVLRLHRHDVDTVADEELRGAPDGAVSAAAAIAGRMLVTLDRGFSELAVRPGSSQGLVVLRPHTQRADHVEAALSDLLEAHSLDDLVGCTVVAGRGRIRIRHPRPDPPTG